jgi:hypothetical protein
MRMRRRDSGSTSILRTGGQRHTADEEDSLFPRLRACAVGALQEMGRLEADHLAAGGLHGSVEQLYAAWILSRKRSFSPL